MSGENLEQERWTTYNGVKVSRPWRVQKAGNEHRQCAMNCADSLVVQLWQHRAMKEGMHPVRSVLCMEQKKEVRHTFSE